MFVSKSGDVKDLPHQVYLRQALRVVALCCAQKVKERESISEVEAPKDNETCDDAIDDSTGMESSCLRDEFSEFQ